MSDEPSGTETKPLKYMSASCTQIEATVDQGMYVVCISLMDAFPRFPFCTESKVQILKLFNKPVHYFWVDVIPKWS